MLSNLTNTKPIRWGICGTGKIATDWVTAIQSGVSSLTPKHEIAAVGSRDASTAKEFADRFSIPKTYNSYEELAADSSLDVIYVCTLNHDHISACTIMMSGGRNVLCEKPLTVTAAEARTLVECAKQHNVLFVEGMWTRFFPSHRKLRELLDQNVIGNIMYVTAHLGFPADKMLGDPQADKELSDRVYTKEHGGGATLDVGSYCVSFASFVFGPQPPQSITALGDLAETGVDSAVAATIKYKTGQFASLQFSMRQELCNKAFIQGDKGFIELSNTPSWQVTDSISVNLPGKSPSVYSYSPMENSNKYWFPRTSQFIHEADHIYDLLQANKKESDIITWNESINVMQTLDEIRHQVGCHLPQDSGTSTSSSTNNTTTSSATTSSTMKSSEYDKSTIGDSSKTSHIKDAFSRLV